MNPIPRELPSLHYYTTTTTIMTSSCSSPEMEASVLAVEKIIGYSFRNKKLLEEALTHSSFTSDGAVSYERLEFLGDPILGYAISKHLFLAYPTLDPAQLSLLRAANISTEKLARVAIRHGLHRYIRHNAPPLILKVKEFVESVAEKDDPVAYGGLVKAPKVLADIVESLAAAVYVDVDFNLKKLWRIIKGLLKPIVTPDDLAQQPQPVTMLFELCQKNGKNVDIKHSRNGAKSIASRHVDGHFVASASSEQKDIARLDAAKAALHKLANLVPASTRMFDFCPGIDGTFEIEAAKQVLHELWGKKKKSKPEYSTRFQLSRKMDVKMEEKRIKHYSNYQKILLVGEGNFSFALSLATAFGSASNIVATSLDSKESLIRNYSRASTNLNVLENLGCTVVHEVDALTMNKHPLLRRKFFDRIVFNFPHAGFDYPEPTSFQIQLHRYVVRGFLKSARKMLCQDGEIHVTHKTSHPFCDWKIVELAEEVEVFLVEEVPFEKWHYPGYVNKRGSGHRCDKSFPVGECSTFKFSKAHDMKSLTREVSALSI